jgi:hypothetical protein
MTATYAFVVVPLDAVAVDTAPTRFAMRLVSTIEFAAGMTSGKEIKAAVRQHPLLGRDPTAPLRSLIMRYDDWKVTRTITAGAPGVKDLSLMYRGGASFSALMAVLEDYLARPDKISVAQLSRDVGHDKHKPEDFLNIARMHDRITALREMLHRSLVARFSLRGPAQLDDLSDQAIRYTQKRWIDGQVQAGLIALIFGGAKAQDLGVGPDGANLAAQLRRDTVFLEARLAPSRDLSNGARGFQAVGIAGEIEVDPKDPNAAVHAALTNSLIAEACGIVTEWTAESAEPIVGDYVMALDPTSFPANVALACKATAFRRQGSTHPLAIDDLGKATTSNGGLAFLNDDKGAPRYSCTGINAEVASVQATVLQANNSVANRSADTPRLLATGNQRRDDRPPVELAPEQFGFNELEASGLTISAPAEDLTTPDALKSPTRETDLPCLFLEDLWIGYRLDLAVEGESSLRSIHRQRQLVTFSGSGRTVRGECENHWPREPGNAETGDISTEIIRFNGLSTAQNTDYAAFLDIDLNGEAPVGPSADLPFSVKVEGCSGVTPLRFRRTYSYRLRNVFQGGVSHSDTDPALAALGPHYVQSASYLRARSFRAGEVVMPDSAGTGAGGNPMSIFLTDEKRTKTILVAPTPVDPDTARYNGQFLAGAAEEERDAQRAFVVDLPAYLRAEGNDAPYYCDPEVSAIKVELWMRNGDPQSTDRDFSFEDGVFCEMVEPLHLGPVTARFGTADRWREFRPIEIILTATADIHPKLKVEGKGRRVSVTVPVAADIALVLTPVVSPDNIRLSAGFTSSNSIAALIGPEGPTIASVLPVVEHRIRAVHCSRMPTAVPAMVSDINALRRGSQAIAILKRDVLSDRAEIEGYIRVDAASSGEVQIEGAWSEIDDDPMHEHYVLKAGRNTARPRSLQFREYMPPGPAASARAWIAGVVGSSAIATSAAKIGRQCAENRVFMGGSKPAGVAAGGEAPPCVLALGSSRRARLTLTATAKSRYSEQFSPRPKQRFELKSKPMLADVPASMLLSAPDISHVMPLVRQVEGSDEGRHARQRLEAIRVYLRRPCFITGPGERLAIACHAGPPPKGKRNTPNKIFTQWGEDPVARTKSEASLRLPRASDFRWGGVATLDPVLYPPDSPEGVESVLYLDDIIREPEAADQEDARLSLASFAVQWDGGQKLWFCDIELSSDFAGWIGLALYRHQPHAHEGWQISRTATWVYSVILKGERVTWIRQNNLLNVTIGPVFDRSIDFQAELRSYEGGISAIADGDVKRLQFNQYEVDGKIYFEGLFPFTKVGIEVIRRRFGTDVASFALDAS